MAALENTIQITPDSLKTSFAKYRKNIIQMPVRALDEAAKFMSRRVGVRGKETVGELAGDMELGPYSLTRKDENGVTITGRTLETFLGSCVKPFEPNAVRESIWGSNVFRGKALHQLRDAVAHEVLVGLYRKGRPAVLEADPVGRVGQVVDGVQ